jgi:hypothetical protein
LTDLWLRLPAHTHFPDFPLNTSFPVAPIRIATNMATTALTASVPRVDDGGSHRTTDDAAPPKTAETNMRCPDPSAHHTKSSALQNQASAAALYSTNPSKGHQHQTQLINPLGPDGKLSSASKFWLPVNNCVMADVCRCCHQPQIREGFRPAWISHCRYRHQVVCRNRSSPCQPEPKEPRVVEARAVVGRRQGCTVGTQLQDGALVAA